MTPGLEHDTPADTEGQRHDTPLEVTIAMSAHTANRFYAIQIGEPDPGPWSMLAALMQTLTIEAVREILAGLVTTSREAHEHATARWKDRGWQYGPNVSFEQQTHPMLVEYDQLTRQQRRRYELLLAIANALRSEP